MKTNLLLPLAALLFTACGPRPNITANLPGFTNDTILIWSCPLSAPNGYPMRQDTLLLTNGTLRATLQTTGPTHFMLIPQQLTDGHGQTLPSSATQFFLDKGERIRIEGIMEQGWVRTSVEGSELNRDLSDFFNNWNPVGAELGKMQVRLEYDPTAADDTLLIASYRACIGKLRTITETYIADNPDREAAGFVMTTGGGAVAEKYFHTLTPEVRNSMFKPLLDKIGLGLRAEQLRKTAQEHIKIGNEAPDFTLKDINGNDFSLSSLRGRYVVLDFWGSWCGWCIKGFPELKTVYARHSGRFDVVGIACNDTPEKWRTAVAANELLWINVINPRNAVPADDLAVRYGISAFPTKIIIDPRGRIVEIFVGETPGFAATMDKLLK